MKTIATFLLLSLLVIMTCSCNQVNATKTADLSDSTNKNTSDSNTIVDADEDDTAHEVTFAFGGDVMMGTDYINVQLPANDGKQLFDHVGDLLRDADIAAVNLEGTLLDGPGDPKKCGDPSVCYTFRTPTRYVQNLVDAGIDFVSVANNHANDFGAPGRKSTRATLDKAGIKYSGTKGICETTYLQRNGVTVAMAAFGFSGGNLSIRDLEYAKKLVKQMKDSADLVVISFHNGAEGKNATHVTHKSETAFGTDRGNPEAFAHAVIDAGADLVWGHGPHVVRGVDLYNGKLILYSLGNFVTPYGMTISGISGHAPVVTVTLDNEGNLIDGKIHSFVQQSGKGPQPDPSNSVATQMSRLTAADFPNSPIKISNTGEILVK